MTTILDVLEKGAAFLTGKGIPDARLNMELLVAQQLECQRMDLYLRFDTPLSTPDLASLRESLKKRAQGVPLQHLAGYVDFHRHRFHCDSRALIPRPETEELVELTLKQKFPRPARVLDLACGSGCLGISIAKALGSDCHSLLLTDLQEGPLALTRENLTALDQEAEVRQSDLFQELAGHFDLITANLPYVPEREKATLAPELAYDPPAALFGGPDGLEIVRRFCAAVPEHLAPGGLVAMEVGHDQGSATAALLQAADLTEIEIATDLSDQPRFVFAWARPDIP